ncbi:MAG: hypothetical protein KDJ27_13750 [Gammaproteobacteria bacterium]|nr:hypothetical protein [Gammaproteobacteria bacterium]MCB1924780.1 hypothetical protein [Gammaproteobacteria bacterium]
MLDGTIRILLLAALVQPAYAYDEDEPLSTAADMSQWCKEMTYGELSTRSDRVFNWTLSIVTRGNAYVVDGKWRVDGQDVRVECRSRIGAARKYATYRILAGDGG